jgi:hypothetical protein
MTFVEAGERENAQCVLGSYRDPGEKLICAGDKNREIGPSSFP